MCPALWLTSALYLIFPLVTFLSNFKNKQKNWLDAMTPSVNSNIRLGKRLPLAPALPEISTSRLQGTHLYDANWQPPHRVVRGVESGPEIAAICLLNRVL